MKLKDKLITFILCAIVVSIYFVAESYNYINDNANKIYSIYLDGKKLGAIDDKKALYALIDEKQQSIKDKYKVDTVYPPNGLKIVENYSYNTEITNLDSIYNKIEELQDFTILGYEIQFSKTKNHDKFSLYVLDKNVFYDALQAFVLAFIDENRYSDYINGSQKELDEIGINYEDMKILESITIREKYISINDKIYENSEELAQELLFGFNHTTKNYVVKAGDTIESISTANSLNTQEFLIANPKFTSKDSLLAIGDTVNITLINPVISFEYSVKEKREIEIDFETEVVRDKTKPSSYSEITTPGVKGLSLQTTRYKVVNGEPYSSIEIVEDEAIRQVVNQIITKGRKEATWGWLTFNDTGSGWRWPTGNPYAITSEFAFRWGKNHNGLDISGTGEGSKIFAANDGVVTKVFTGCPNNGSYPNSCGGGFGNYVTVNHGDGITTTYAHMLNSIPVREGQSIKRGTVVGYMGNSGQSQGVHLHFGVTKNGSWINPRLLYK